MFRGPFVAALCLLALPLHACDVCGIFLGIQPNDRASSFGLVYRMRYLEGRFAPPPPSPLKHGGAEDLPVPTHRTETYQALELRADIRLDERWSIWAMLPVVNNYASSNGGVDADIYGVGDPTVLGRWIAVNTRQYNDSVRWRHRLTVGVGPKLPIGPRTMTYDDRPVDHDLQPGTGTVDGILSLEYLVRRGTWGVGLSSVTRLNSRRTDGFRAAHGYNGTLEMFRVFEGERVQWMPSVGGYVEVMSQDRYAGTADSATGGTTFFSHAGIKAWRKQWGAHVHWQHALAQRKGRDMMPDQERVLLGLTYILPRR